MQMDGHGRSTQSLMDCCPPQIGIPAAHRACGRPHRPRSHSLWILLASKSSHRLWIPRVPAPSSSIHAASHRHPPHGSSIIAASHQSPRTAAAQPLTFELAEPRPLPVLILTCAPPDVNHQASALLSAHHVSLLSAFLLSLSGAIWAEESKCWLNGT
jgi:hypothetical protein